MIYLDHAAATPVSPRVFEAMEPYFSDCFFNPSAAYLPAKQVAAEYETAKGVIAHAIGAKSSDLIMTAGATEANNLAFSVLGIAPMFLGTGLEFMLQKTPVLYLATEHDSVRRVAERYGGVPIDVDKNGRILMDDLKAILKNN